MEDEKSKKNDTPDDMIFSSAICLPGVRPLVFRNWSHACFPSTIPAGACETCDGLGVKQFFDEKRVIVDEHLSLWPKGRYAAGTAAIFIISSCSRSLAEHYGFTVETPWNKLPAKFQKIILKGSGTEKIDFTFVNERGD